MHIRVYKYLEIHQVIFESQFGFQQGKSTYHSLIEIVEKNRNSIENKNYGCGIFIDLKKAFDTVNHNILLLKLEHYGIRGNITVIIKTPKLKIYLVEFHRVQF